MKFIEPAELKAWLDAGKSFQLIDTRVTEKYETDHIQSAISIPQLEMPDMLDLVDKTATIVIYCIYGVKSEQVYVYLKDKLKIKELYILDGGIYKYATEIDLSLDI